MLHEMLQEGFSAKKRQIPHLFPRRFGVNLGAQNPAQNPTKNPPRNPSQNPTHIHLFGAPKSGKTSVALGALADSPNAFYIDFGDPRNVLGNANGDAPKNAPRSAPRNLPRNLIEGVKNHLLKIAMEKKIEALILDNPPEGLSLPQIPHLITIAEAKAANPAAQNRLILPLNFAEFIALDRQNHDVGALLDSFIKHGNLPFIFALKEPFRLEAKQQFLRGEFGGNLAIFAILCRFQAQRFSAHHLYNLAKRQLKTSKDSVYALVLEWQRRGILWLVPHFSSANAAKKAFLWDFSLPNALSYEKNILSIIENMLFLELLGLEFLEAGPLQTDILKTGREIFYSEKINLICGTNGYILAPFSPKERIAAMLKNIDFMGLDITVVTLQEEGEITLNNKTVRLKSFVNLALGE